MTYLRWIRFIGSLKLWHSCLKVGKNYQLTRDLVDDTINESQKMLEYAIGMTPTNILSLLTRSGGQICAFFLEQVVEIMRPLPIAKVADAPAFVAGLSVLRGRPRPVLFLDKLVAQGQDDGESQERDRFVLVRYGQESIALLVREVLGIHPLSKAQLEATPPLLKNAHPEMLSQIGSLDGQLLFLLNTQHILSPELWTKLNETHR